MNVRIDYNPLSKCFFLHVSGTDLNEQALISLFTERARERLELRGVGSTCGDGPYGVVERNFSIRAGEPVEEPSGELCGQPVPVPQTDSSIATFEPCRFDVGHDGKCDVEVYR